MSPPPSASLKVHQKHTMYLFAGKLFLTVTTTTQPVCVAIKKNKQKQTFKFTEYFCSRPHNKHVGTTGRNMEKAGFIKQSDRTAGRARACASPSQVNTCVQQQTFNFPVFMDTLLYYSDMKVN